MGMSFYLRNAIEQGKQRERDRKRKQLEEDVERQRIKAESLQSMNSVKAFQENAKEMHEKIIKA